MHSSARLNMLRYTRRNVVILMAATAWLRSFSSCIVCGYDSYTVLSKCPQRNFLWWHLESTVYESNPHTIQELRDNIIHAAAAIKITTLHRVYLYMVTERRCWLTVQTLYVIYVLTPERMSQGHVQNGRWANFSGPPCTSFTVSNFSGPLCTSFTVSNFSGPLCTSFTVSNFSGPPCTSFTVSKFSGPPCTLFTVSNFSGPPYTSFTVRIKTAENKSNFHTNIYNKRLMLPSANTTLTELPRRRRKLKF